MNKSVILRTMCKKFFLLLAATILVGISTTVFAASYTDVQGTPYNTAYEYLTMHGVVRGYADGTGRPNAYLNRAEAIKVITQSHADLQKQVQTYADNMPPLPLFRDMQQSLWYAPHVEAAFATGVVQGYPDGTFRGHRLLTIEEAVTLLVRTTGEVSTDSTVATLSANIANQSHAWFTPYINTAIARNLIMPQRTLRLGQPITRGQFFDMVYRQMTIAQANVPTFVEVPTSAPATSIATTTASPIQANAPVATIRAPTISQTTGVAVRAPQPQTSTVSLGSNPNASEKYFAISMPSLGIQDLSIIHPEDPFSSQGLLAPLKNGVGHLFSYPGGGGKIMIYGHSSGYPWDVSKYTKIFRRVNELKTGDKIYVTYEGKLHTYEVSYEQTIDAKDTSPFSDNGSGEELVLYTCWPPDSIAQRYLVHAKKVEEVALR